MMISNNGNVNMPKISSVNKAGNIGTSLMGYITISYSVLVEKLGEPNVGSYKTDAEWVVEFDNGDIATVYNYKDGKNYNGAGGLETIDITEWHIGGSNQNVRRWLTDHLLSNWPPAFEAIRQEAEY